MSRKLSLFAIILCLLFSFVSVSPASAGGLDYDKSQIKPTEMQAKDTGSFWDFLPFDFGDGLKDTLNKIEKFFKPVIEALEDAIDWAAKGIKGLADWWESLDDWTKDLIYTILAVLAVVVVAVAAFFLLPFVGIALLIGAIIGAIVAGAFYFWKYGGTDAFGWGVLAWAFGGAALGALGAWLYSIGAVGAMAGMLRAGLARGLTAALSGMRTFGGWIGQGMRYVGRGMRTFASWIGQGAKRFGAFVGRNAMRFGRWASATSRTVLGSFYVSWKAFAINFGIGAGVTFFDGTFLALLQGDSINWGELAVNVPLNGALAAIGGPIAGKMKAALTTKSFGQFAKWAGISGMVGGPGYAIGEWMKGGFENFDPMNIVIGGVGSAILSPVGVVLYNAPGYIPEYLNQKVGDPINNRIKDIIYWNNSEVHPNNWSKEKITGLLNKIRVIFNG